MKKTARRILNWAASTCQALSCRLATDDVTTPAGSEATPADADTAMKDVLTALADLQAQVTALKAELAELKAGQEKEEQEKNTQKEKKAEKPLADHSRSAVVQFNEQFLKERYELRYNVLKRATEYRARSASGDGPWQPLTERDLNRLTVEQLKAGGGSWSYAMRLCTESSSVPSYHPVHDWLQSCPAWDGRDHIGDLARRVPTSYERWPEFFHRWVLAMVAQATGMGGRHGNSMVPLLIGGQGLRKSTFCRSILPPELREYFMDDIKMDSAEQVERVLARMWLVCIDEYNAKTPREQARIKRLLTEKDVQVRRPRSEEYRLVPRLCSFIATTNDPQPLPSGDGTRRYLCVEVEGMIDLESPIDHRQLFAQALAELRREGCVYWFTAEDEAEIQRHNEPYQQASALETVLPALFEPTLDRRRENLWQVQAVQKVLARELRTADVPSLRQLASAMKALRWPQGAACGTRGYYLRVRSEE